MAKKRNQQEAREQRAFFQILSLKYPEIRKMTFSIPNGGYRNAFEAKLLQQEGVTPGVPDICLAVARGDYHAMYIEMKKPASIGSPRGRTSAPQREWILNLRKEGNLAIICYGCDEALREIVDYWNRKPW